MKPLRACMVAWSPIADDPRVRRMGDSLAAAGWEVVGIGLPGARSAPPAWPILETHAPVARRSDDPLSRCERGIGRAAAAGLGPVERILAAKAPMRALWLARVRRVLEDFDQPVRDSLRALLRRACRMANDRRLSVEERRMSQFARLSPHVASMRQLALDAARLSPALWIANDWWTLPAAAEAVDRGGGALAYDSHELAVEEYSERPEWVRFQRPIVAAVEARFIRRAAIVTSVSPGITNRLRETYALTAPTMTVRNTPNYRRIAFRPTGRSVGVLYHGVVAPGRGLEAAIDGVSTWRPEFALHIRGPSAPEYAGDLRRRAEAAGVGSRVLFHRPVPMTELVSAAAEFNIGLMALPAHSQQNVHALPNKLFEYLMAGLALAVTDLPEMARLVAETRAGVLISEATPAAIAAAINSLSPAMLDEMRKAALAAAERLNWEREAPPVLAAYAALMREPVSEPAA